MEWKFKYYDIKTGPNWDAIYNEFDWFRDMETTEQDKIWHKEGNVMIHTKMVCNELIKLPEFICLSEQDKHIMFVSALMHDIEKRSTTETVFKNNRDCVVAPKHAERGEKTARTLLYKDLGCPYHIREKICKVISWHGKPLHKNSTKTLVKMATLVPLSFLAMIAKADILGRDCNDSEEHLERIEFFKMLSEEQECFNEPRKFRNEYDEYVYLNEGEYIDYEVFDETKFKVIMLSGLPGSGKDTFIKNNYPNTPIVSIDDIRRELKVKPTDKSGNGRAIQLAKERAKIQMRLNNDFIWNATNITTQMRSQLVDLFKSYGGKVEIIYIEVPYLDLVKQNNNRVFAVPLFAVERLINKLEPPIKGEAHSVKFYLDS